MSYELGECLDISTINTWHPVFIQWLESPSPISIDAAKVTRIDTAGMQALASLFLSAQRAGKTIILSNLSDVLKDGIQLLDLESLLVISQD